MFVGKKAKGRRTSSFLKKRTKKRKILTRKISYSSRFFVQFFVGTADPHIRRQLWEIIKTLKSSSVTVILTTHYLDEAEYLSDRVCLIHDGIIRTIDSPDNLKKSHQKNNLEEVFLKFVDNPGAEIFNALEKGPS